MKQETRRKLVSLTGAASMGIGLAGAAVAMAFVVAGLPEEGGGPAQAPPCPEVAAEQMQEEEGAACKAG